MLPAANKRPQIPIRTISLWRLASTDSGASGSRCAGSSETEVVAGGSGDSGGVARACSEGLDARSMLGDEAGVDETSVSASCRLGDTLGAICTSSVIVTPKQTSTSLSAVRPHIWDSTMLLVAPGKDVARPNRQSRAAAVASPESRNFQFTLESRGRIEAGDPPCARLEPAISPRPSRHQVATGRAVAALGAVAGPTDGRSTV